MKTGKKDAVSYGDPRNVAETFINEPLSIYQVSGNLHLTLGIERPAADAKPGSSFAVEREIVVRLVMPEATAKKIANAIEISLGPLGQAPLNRPLQS